jgi:hypothetical protein
MKNRPLVISVLRESIAADPVADEFGEKNFSAHWVGTVLLWSSLSRTNEMAYQN